MSNIFVPASPDELKFSGVEFVCPVKLFGKPNARAALSSGGVYKGSTARSLDIYPDETEEGDTGVAVFTVYSIEEAEYIVEQFTIAFNEEYKMAIWKSARDSFKESKSL